jgi:solute carrier family 41
MGNLALLQVQALIVSFVAGLVAFLLGLLSRVGISSTSTSADDRGSYFECIMVGFEGQLDGLG